MVLRVSDQLSNQGLLEFLIYGQDFAVGELSHFHKSLRWAFRLSVCLSGCEHQSVNI